MTLCVINTCGGKNLDTHQLTVNFKVAKPKEWLNVCIFKRDKAESFASACFAVQHDCGINYFPKLGKELAHRL